MSRPLGAQMRAFIRLNFLLSAKRALWLTIAACYCCSPPPSPPSASQAGQALHCRSNTTCGTANQCLLTMMMPRHLALAPSALKI
jgi:hypothetical protein